MIIVHHLNKSRSQRILWLLEEFELEYEVVTYERLPSMAAPASLKQVHPLGKSPVIVDRGANGEELVVAESGAIIEYLVDRYGAGRLKPQPGSSEYLKYQYWMHFAEGSFMPPLVMYLIFSTLPPRVPFFIRPFAHMICSGVINSYLIPSATNILQFVEGELEKSTWFAGAELSAADIQMSFPLEAAETRIGFADFPKIREFLERVRARPAYARASARVGGSFL